MSSRPQNAHSRGGRGGRGGGRGGRRRGKVNREDALMQMTSDEDVLIAFAPFTRSDNAEALAIHAQFQSSNDQVAFVKAARQFLDNNAENKGESMMSIPSVPCPDPPASKPSTSVPTQPPGIIILDEKMEGLTLTVKEDPVLPMPKTPPPTCTAAAPPPGLASPIFALEGNWALASPGLTAINTPQPETPLIPDEAPETPILVDDVQVPPEAYKPKYQPRRLWTRIEEQPGRILANNFPFGHVANVRPRQELTAQWMLPLNYLQKHAQERFVGSEEKMTLRDALQHLCVGLFRRGCAENSSSIISKEILADSTTGGNKDYPYQVRGEAVVGTVPFYSPRTPGNVVLRLFWQNDPVHTLATGPTLVVKVDKEDVEPTLRFILSNFKAKKGSATSLSSILSLTTVLENFSVVSGPRQGWEKAAWGCLCEARKVFEVCGREYLKTKDKLAKLEKEVEELREQLVVVAKGEAADDDELAEKLNEKMSALMGGRSSNERKWRDAQLAYANMLRPLVTNKFCSVLASPDLITKSKLELELWCPLCESFAPSPVDSDKWDTTVHLKKCVQSRESMQLDVLGFIPNSIPLEKVLSPDLPRSRNNQKQSMDPVAVEALNRLSASMGELYQREYLVSDRIHKQRELVRSHIESVVARCDAFPVGTRVVVFGSSANGFGSPSSDLDMCLQLPPNTKLADEGDDTGAQAMGKLAELFEEGGMKDVNTDRLTARIPIVMFTCPRPMAGEDQDPMMECDVSMQNPLACLNTSLLLTYSQIHPVTRVLASIVKRWAKSRDINSPSDHTLSTYGYILMLLHFLTFHRKTGSGLVTTIDHRDDRSSWTPLLPNLQWMDPSWPESQPGTPYRELATQPKQLMPHPLDHSDFVVNTYFYRLKDQSALTQLQKRFPGQDVSIAILLASFFRYYAYEFDYKRGVVSLNSTSTKIVEREAKAETNGWRVFWNGLSIEDPFETFYDVAHVVKGSNYHRIRNEFALAYTKIVKAAAGSCEKDLIDWICEPYVKPSED